MEKKILLFAPMTFNLAETTRMIEIAKGIVHHDIASKVFDIQFMSDGGEFEGLIEEQHFPLHRMEPRLTPEKIEHLLKIDKAEKIAPSFSVQEISERMRCIHQCPQAAIQIGKGTAGKMRWKGPDGDYNPLRLNHL